MKKLFDKHETFACIALIVAYVVINSLCLNSFGLADIRTVAVNCCFSAALIALMLALGRTRFYGITKVADARAMLWFILLAVISTVNLWCGVHPNAPAGETALHIANMINIGFIEEIIFRGFLFRMMQKSNEKSAIAVSAVTFGIGHVVNLLNGAQLVPTLLQIASATAIGLMFVVIFTKCGSLIPCILSHAFINSSSIFAVENEIMSYITTAVVIVISLAYTAYIVKKAQTERSIS